MSQITLRAVVDRIDGEWAVLLIGDHGDCVNWPIYELPGHVVEGDVLTISIRRDVDAAAAARDEMNSMIDRLRRGE